MSNAISAIFAYKGSENLVHRDVLQAALSTIGIGMEYVAIGLLGIGEEGAVIKAQSRQGNIPVAIKIASPALLAKGKQATKLFALNKFNKTEQNKFRLRWINGCEVQRLLANSLPSTSILYVPKIIKLIESPLTVIMEFVDGITVLRYVTERRSFKDSMLLFLKLLTALKDMHKLGVVHRDLKPENIFITGDSINNPRIGVVDWTLAKFIGTDGITTVDEHLHIGTVPYASPKQMLSGDAAYATPTDDVFAIGVMLSEFCSFKKVPRPKNVDALRTSTAAVKAYIELLKTEVNPLVRPIFTRATAINETERYNSLDPFLYEFDKLIKSVGFFESARVFNLSLSELRDIVLQNTKALASIKYNILRTLHDETNVDLIDDVDFS